MCRQARDILCRRHATPLLKLLPFLLLLRLELLAMPPQPFRDLIHKLLRFIVNLAIVLGDRLRQFLEGDETVRLAMRPFLVLIGEKFEEPIAREWEVVVAAAERGEVELLVLDHGVAGRVDGVLDGVDPATAGLEEELALEHEEDVEVVVLLGALFVPWFGAAAGRCRGAAVAHWRCQVGRPRSGWLGRGGANDGGSRRRRL